MTTWRPRGKLTEPISRAIVHALALDIEEAILRGGDRLPTHRELAEVLGCAVGTVTRAYALAREQGLITGTTGRGTFVAGEISPEQGSGPADLTENLIVCDSRDPSLRNVLAAMAAARGSVSLINGPHPPCGDKRHREVAARWMSRDAFQPPANSIVLCAGVQHALNVVLATTAKPGDLVVAEEVTYSGIRALAALLHLRLEGLGLDEEGILPALLEEACRRGAKCLYVTPTLHNPTTATMSDRRRRDIARVIEQYNLTVVEDDVYGFLAPDAPPPLAAYTPDHTYYLMGTSKRLAPGLRIAYASCPKGTEQRLAGAVRSTIWAATPLVAELVTRWIEDGAADRTTAWKQREIEARNDIARRILGPDLAPARPSPHWWLPLPPDWTADDYVARCRARGVLITAAAAFSVTGTLRPKAVRICLGAAATREYLEGGLRIIKDTLTEAPFAGFTVT